jgi:alcohol dehydrogenase (cytochrome c)
LIWAYNITPTDMWDLDEPLITPLLDLNIGGTTRKVAVKAARNGMFYVWDRANGKLVNEPWMHTFQDIMRGVDMQTGLPMYDITKVMFTDLADRRRYTQSDPYANNKPADYTGTEVIFCPGTAARNWENDAFSPRTNLLYTATDNSCGALRMIKGDYTPNNAMTGGYRLRVSLTGAPSLDLDGRPTTVQGQLIASDPVGRKRVWAKEFTTDANRNPILATAGDLLFQGGNDRGVLRAMNARTGDTVWEFRAGARFHQSPITYSQGGKQFVAIIASSAAANTAVAANAAPDNANRYRRSGTTLYVFKLPG